MTELEGQGVTGDFDRQKEVEALLLADDTALGDVFRARHEGKTVAQIAEESAITTGPVYAYFSLSNALLDGTTKASPTVAAGWAARIRGWLKNKQLSPQLRDALDAQQEALTNQATDPAANKAEDEEAVTKSKQAEATNDPGIYVYTLPHYVRHPFDRKTGRTLLKVGHSSKSAIYRANSQARSTELPEDPWLLRIYPTDSSAEMEKKFHAFLRAADHQGEKGNRSGAEWFLTSPKFLDHVALSLDLSIIVVKDFDIPED